MEEQKINVAIVGLGNISSAHIAGLKNGGKYNIYATCDTITERKSIADELNCKFFADYKELCKDKNVEVVLILTPPATHYIIAKEALENKKHVLIEKPGVTDIKDLYDLIEIAKNNEVTVDVIFHWVYGSEVLYLEKHFKEYGKLLKVEGNVYDPYTYPDGITIKEERIPLSGAWNDSGINVLSMLSIFLDLNKFKLEDEQLKYDSQYNLPIYANKKYTYEDIDISITVDWRYNRNHKFTNFYFEKGTLFLHHTAQEIWFNAKRVESFYTENRLHTHYTNLFNLYNLKTKDHDRTIMLHKLLLQTLKKDIKWYI